MLNTSINPSAQPNETRSNLVAGFTTPKLMLHLEGLVLLGAAVALYANQGFAWSSFWLLLLAPDLSALPFAWSRKMGTFFYNAFHTITLPLVLLTIAFLTNWTFGMQIALIWLAHIGMDRTAGYGLKYTDSFKNTHLGKV